MGFKMLGVGKPRSSTELFIKDRALIPWSFQALEKRRSSKTEYTCAFGVKLRVTA